MQGRQSGGLMQLVSYGSEDLYLTGNPQVTIFKSAYQRHTNFAYEWVPSYFEPTLSFETSSETIMKLKIKRHGDLIRDLVLVIDIPNIFSSEEENFKWIKKLGHTWIMETELVIAGQRINHLYGQWLNIWSELITPISRRRGFDELTGNVIELTDPAVYYGTIQDTSNPTIQKRRLRIPISFWFTENPGLAIPLIAAQYVDIHINVEFRQLNDLFTIGIPAVSPIKLFEDPITCPNSNHVKLRNCLISQGFNSNNIFWKFVSGLRTPGIWNQNVYMDIKYVYLDNTERRIFAAAVSEYLITQVERKEFRGLQGSFQEDIEFYHPVKEMIWVFQRDDVQNRNQWTNYTTLTHDEDYNTFLELVNTRNELVNLGLNPSSIDSAVLPSGLTVEEFLVDLNCTDTSKLSLVDIDAFDEYLNIMYFAEFLFNAHLRQNRKSAIYYQYQDIYNVHTTTPSDNQIYVFSFAEAPESYQPSGSANFSMYKIAQFRAQLKERIPNGTCQDNKLFNCFFYVRNVNIVRFISGIAGLVFAN